MNEKIFILRCFGQPEEADITLHPEGLAFISNHLTQAVIPDIYDLMDLIKQFISNKSSEFNHDLSFINTISYSGIKLSFINKLSPDAKVFVSEMEHLVKDFMRIYLIDEVNDIYGIPDEYCGTIDYLEFKISNSLLNPEEMNLLLNGIGILRVSYNYWTNIFTSESNVWKTWWASVGYNVNDIRKYSNNGDWIIASYNAAMEGLQIGKIYNMTGWGSVAGALFAASICAIFPAQKID